MKILVLAVFLIGCGRGELVNRSEKEDFFAESPTDSVTAVYAPINVKRFEVSQPDSVKGIDWPDNRPLKFLHWFGGKDTHGNPINVALRVELQQIVGDSIYETFTLTERVNYIVSGDTIIISVERLKGLNIKASDEYAYLWRFRYRAENTGAFEKFSEWSYSTTIKLMDASKLWGIPQKPKRLIIIRQ